MSINDIPNELKQLKRWVGAFSHSKAPMRLTEYQGASTTDSTTWGSYEDAVQLCNMKIYDNIGFVFADDGYVGIDIDDGFDDDGFVSLIASDIISQCESYTEKSRSGRGFHIILKGTLPFNGKNNRAGVEIYKTGRYFIMTGETMLYKAIIDNQKAIDYVLDKYFKEDEKTAENALKVPMSKIYRPDWSNPIHGNRVRLRPDYPVIDNGCRNICLTSLAGNLHTQGYTKKQIYDELVVVNQTACKPPVSTSEIKTICNSVTRYKR